MKIYLARHGQTTGDVEDRYGGDYDDHLTNKGKAQSEMLAEKFLDKGVEVVFASPRIRAQETAKIVAENLKVPVKTIENIRERNAYGILTGLVKEEARQKYPEAVEQVKSYKNTVEGAESYEHFKERILRSFEEITSSNFQTIIIIAHGGPINCFFREVLKKEIAKLSDCGFAEIEKKDGYRLIKVEGMIVDKE